MLLDKKESAIAYRCPYCGDTVTSMVGIFALSGDMIKLRCGCGESEMQLSYTSDRKIRLNVPCIACPRPHNYVIGQNTFFSKDKGAFRLPCSYTGIDICFIGAPRDVTKAVEQSNDELMKMLEEAGLDDLSRIRDDEDINVERDPQVEETVRYAIASFDDEGKIKCRCQTSAIAKYDFIQGDNGVTIFCGECGASATLPIFGVGDAYDFLNGDGVELK